MKKTNYSNMTAIAVNKSLLKEYQTSYGRTVYLDKDSEFQIKLFNPTTETIAADIFVNGKSLGEKIIIRPGQLIWLERYLDEAKKFRFDTYEVEANVEEVKQAIRNNGDIKVKFYKEKQSYNWTREFNDAYYGKTEINSALNWYNAYNSCSTENINNISLKPIVGTIDYCPCNYSISSDMTSINGTVTSYSTAASLYIDKKSETTEPTETGRVEKSGYSNQRFDTINLDIESWAFATEEIKLLPKSQKPVYKEDLEKLYCPECGRKVKTKFKYCPFCGEKLQNI